MSSEAVKTKSGGARVLNYVIGLILMIAGGYVSMKVWPNSPGAEYMHNMGLPLDPGKTVAVIGVFLILFDVMEMFFFKPLNEAIQARNGELESTFTEAEQLRSDMSKMKVDYEKRLTDTEANAREQIQAQVKEAQELRKTLMAEAQGKADELVAKAQEEIAGEKAKALADIRVHVAGLSMMATEKILGENMDNERNRKLVDEFLDKVEARN